MENTATTALTYSFLNLRYAFTIKSIIIKGLTDVFIYVLLQFVIPKSHKNWLISGLILLGLIIFFINCDKYHV